MTKHPSILSDGTLSVIPASRQLLQAELNDPTAVFDILDVCTPPYWPPDLNDDDSFRYALNLIPEGAEAVDWGFYYVLLDEDGARHAIGVGGFKEQPDENGEVEIGYSILAPYRRRGYATRMCRLLTGHAFADPSVTAVTATTLPDLIPSIGVLEKLGFRQTNLLDGIVYFTLPR